MACTNRGLRSTGALLLSLFVLSACSVAGPRKSPLPEEGPNMKEIYDSHGSASRAPAAQDRAGMPLRPALDATGIDTQNQAIVDSIEQRFPRVPNPDLVMWVAPHLSGDRYPVPGYYTVFPMYERVEYLLPGEAGAWHGQE